MTLSPKFWETKSLTEMSEEEWEALCDGCGICCYRKFIAEDETGEEDLYFTRIACNLLDTKTGKCTNYPQRFEIEEDCTKLTKQNLKDFSWLPKTCAYRLIYEGKSLFDWHPLISSNPKSVKLAGVFIKNGIHEKDVIDWFDFIIDEI